MRFRLMHLIVLPPQTLRDAQPSPLFLIQQLQRAARPVEVLFGYRLEHLLRELDVAVLVMVVAVSVCRRQSRSTAVVCESEGPGCTYLDE